MSLRCIFASHYSNADLLSVSFYFQQLKNKLQCICFYSLFVVIFGILLSFFQIGIIALDKVLFFFSAKNC